MVYAARRIAAGVVLVVILSMIIFACLTVLPGDIAGIILGRFATAEQRAAFDQQFGLDESAVSRYIDWVTSLIHGDMGTSYTSGEPVSSMFIPRMENTLILAGVAFAVMVPISLLIGVLGALRAGKTTDHVLSVVGLIGAAVPEFVWGTLFALFFGLILGVLPPVSLIPAGGTPLDDPQILVLPVLTLTVVAVAYISEIVRADMIGVLTSDYVQAARLNGISEQRVVFVHAFRNALAPAIQVLARTLPWLIGGVVLVETVFSYPGIGLELVQSVGVRDIPFVLSVATILGAFTIFLNIVADLLVIAAVPKLRSQPQ